MAQMNFVHALFSVVLIVVLTANMIEADCLSGKFKGGCAIWDYELCRRHCVEEGHVSGHCSPSLKCWCSGC